MKPCLKHANVFMKGSGLKSRGEKVVEITCTDPTKFELYEDGELEDIIDLAIVAKGRVDCGGKLAVLRKIEKASGLNCNPDGVLADKDLRQSFP